LKKVFEESVVTISDELDLSEINLDGSHSLAKKGGESVAYQGRKKAKTTNILPLSDASGYIIGLSQLLAGNHNDAFELTPSLQKAFKTSRGLFSTRTAPSTPKQPVKSVSITASFPTSLKTNVTARSLSVAANVVLTVTSTNVVSSQSALLLG
jgi:hypothetical protein